MYYHDNTYLFDLMSAACSVCELDIANSLPYVAISEENQVEKEHNMVACEHFLKFG